MRFPVTNRKLFSIAVLFLNGVGVYAQGVVPEPPPCVANASVFHSVNPWVLRAIIWQESSNRNEVVTRNSNGTLDIGLGGINTVHLSELQKFGIAPERLLDGCVNTYVTAWHLSRQIQRDGNNWLAIGAYHSRTPGLRENYAQRIRSHLIRWGVMPP